MSTFAIAIFGLPHFALIAPYHVVLDLMCNAVQCNVAVCRDHKFWDFSLTDYDLVQFSVGAGRQLVGVRKVPAGSQIKSCL